MADANAATSSGVVRVHAGAQRVVLRRPTSRSGPSTPVDARAGAASPPTRRPPCRPRRPWAGRRAPAPAAGRERVELAALLRRPSPTAALPLRAARDHGRLARHLAEQGGVGVVRRGRSRCRRGPVARSRRKISRVQVGALEAQQEHLRDLALDRQPPREVGDAACHVRAPGRRSLRSRGRRDHPGEERQPLLAARRRSPPGWRCGDASPSCPTSARRWRGHGAQGPRAPPHELRAGRFGRVTGVEAIFQRHARRRYPDAETVVMKFGGTSVADAERIKRAARRIVRGQGGRQPRRRRALGAREDDRRAGRDGPRGLRPPAPARDGHAAVHRRADLVRARGDGDQRPRSRGDLADRLAGRHRHRHLAHQGAHRRGPGRPHPRGARRRQDRARRRLPGRLDRRSTSPRSAAAAPTPPRSRSRPRSAPTSARSTPTWPACSAPTRGSCPTRASCRSSRSRRCSRWRRPAPACSSFARSSTRATTACAIHCRSSFEDGPGTVVVDEQQTMERPLVTAVTHSTDEARITLTGLPDQPGHRRPRAHRARRGEHQRRHDHPERAARRGPRRRHVVHGPARRPQRRRATRSKR